MKNASKYSDALKALLKKIVKDRPERPEMEPLLAIVRGTLSMGADNAAVDAAMEAINAEFVDLNELRVATELEVVDLIGDDHPGIDDKATVIRAVLHSVFDHEQTLRFDRVKELKKAEVRTFLKDLDMIPPFVEAFVGLHSFDIAAFPVDDRTLDYLIDNDVVEEETTHADAQSFLESHIKSDDLYGSYLAVREKALGYERKKPAKKEAAAKKK